MPRPLAVLALAVLAGACGSSGPTPPPAPTATLGTVRVTSPDLGQGTFPVALTCDGADRAPVVSWEPVVAPGAGARPPGGWVVEMLDPDAPGATFTHWVLYAIPGTVRSTVAGAASGVAGRNSFGTVGYRGPCPPAGSTHHYHIVVLELDSGGPREPGLTRDALDQEVAAEVMAKGELTATYRR